MIFTVTVQADWKIDLSRRIEQLGPHVIMNTKPVKKVRGVFEDLLNSKEPVREVVILNTNSGFIPSVLRLKEGASYRFHVVNVSKKAKNVSFVMEDFSEFHGTYYGQVVSFYIHPKKTGVYTYQCPETSAQGRLVVVPSRETPVLSPEVRLPASRE